MSDAGLGKLATFVKLAARSFAQERLARTVSCSPRKILGKPAKAGRDFLPILFMAHNNCSVSANIRFISKFTKNLRTLLKILGKILENDHF